MMTAKQNKLADLRILITRPAQQAHTLCQSIEQQGGQAILLPTIVIENIKGEDDVSLVKELKKIAEQDIAIFISPNAVHAAVALMKQQGLVWPHSLIMAAIGISTAKTLISYGLQVSLTPKEQFNSEGLLALPAFQSSKGKKIIIFRGKGGRELLSASLQERDALVTEMVVYERLLPSNDIKQQVSHWQNGRLDIIVCTSNTGLQNLITMIESTARNWLLNMPLLVISKRMALFALTLGFVKPPIVASNATDEAITQALIEYNTRK